MGPPDQQDHQARPCDLKGLSPVTLGDSPCDIRRHASTKGLAGPPRSRGLALALALGLEIAIYYTVEYHV